METHIVLGNSPETIRKLCLSAKFLHQEIWWDFGICQSERLLNLLFCLFKFHFLKTEIWTNEKYSNCLESSNFNPRWVVNFCLHNNCFAFLPQNEAHPYTWNKKHFSFSSLILMVIQYFNNSIECFFIYLLNSCGNFSKTR